MRRTPGGHRPSLVPSPCSLRRLVPLLLGALVASTAASAAVIEGTTATFTWQPASGPVAGYRVFVFRNGVPPTAPDHVVGAPAVDVSGEIADRLAIQVAAFDGAGSEGPRSAMSEVVFLTAPAPPPFVVVEASGDFSVQAARALATAGEQVVAHLRGSGKQLFDTALDPTSGIPEEDWGLDQLVVGDPGQPARVRLIDALGLEGLAPLADPGAVTLFGLGNGPPCERDGAGGLLIHEGSRLVLGGIDLFVFDGESCVHVNPMFASSPDPNLLAWGEGEIQLHGDLEDDGVLDPDDNCLLVANVDQCDGDRDGVGSACDFDVNNDGAVGLDDLSMVNDAAEMVSQEPSLDLNCDGVVGMDDLGAAMRNLEVPPGPTGWSCAADASCHPPN